MACSCETWEVDWNCLITYQAETHSQKGAVTVCLIVCPPTEHDLVKKKKVPESPRLYYLEFQSRINLPGQWHVALHLHTFLPVHAVMLVTLNKEKGLWSKLLDIVTSWFWPNAGCSHWGSPPKHFLRNITGKTVVPLTQADKTFLYQFSNSNVFHWGTRNHAFIF